jgi:hypothetical protein
LGFAQHRESIRTRHAQIADHQIEAAPIQDLDGFLAIRRLGHSMPQAFDGTFYNLANLRFVVDN